LNSLKEHIVACGRCQAILAQLEATDEISLQAFQQEEVAAKEAVPVPAPRSVETIPAAAAPGESQRPGQAPSPKRSRRILILRGARWQWLAPAGALAAGLLVWIALHEKPTVVCSGSEASPGSDEPDAPSAGTVSFNYGAASLSASEDRPYEASIPCR